MSFEKTLREEIAKRRTFGIISHPDAGKTTLTEKLLLFGGAIQMAGTVKARKAARHATSDWMAVEKERGISVTSSVMKFTYDGYEVNLLDTPGHQDFSEDTYRVLTAVDSALIVIDAAKGVETQTRKLMDVCRMRQTPVMTFINKLDREGLAPLDVMADIEEHLGIECVPLTWPVGMGQSFKGTYNIARGSLLLFSPTHGGRKQEPAVRIAGLEDPLLDEHLGDLADQLRLDMELLTEAGTPFSVEKYLQGKQTPVFFGSAINNFGVRELLETFVELAPAPGPRQTTTRIVSPDEPEFTGFVFKIQANMDKAHRDRIAFVRVCSGRFDADEEVYLVQQQRKVKLSRPQQLMAAEREIIEEAYAGDIIGVFDPGMFTIGDTLCAPGKNFQFDPIPTFAPEHFRRVRPKDTLKRKQFIKGTEQIAQEGGIQIFKIPYTGMEEVIVGVVGTLQFDVFEYRMKNEYKVDLVMESLPYEYLRGIDRFDGDLTEDRIIGDGQDVKLVEDYHGAKLLLFSAPWSVNWVMDKNRARGLDLSEFGGARL